IWRDPAHGGPQGGKGHPPDQPRPPAPPDDKARLHGHRRPEGDRARALRGDPQTTLAALLLALAVAVALFARRAWFLIKLLRSGRPAGRFNDVSARVRLEATDVLAQRKLLQRWLPGLMHAAIFWGFLV